MSELLFMLRLPVDMHRFWRYAGERGWVFRHGFDEGRALHHIVDEMFGPASLRPFRLMVAPRGRHASLYAYTRMSPDTLERQRRETSCPATSDIFGTAPLAWKEMPTSWTQGRKLAFDLRVRPVSRINAELPNPHPDQPPYKPGAEVDAFIVEASRKFPESPLHWTDGTTEPTEMVVAGRTREAVYLDWLKARLGEAVELDRRPDVTRMTSFRRTRVARHGRRPIEGPEAIFHGELTIKDPQAFSILLARGIGRHKAYGYGMLLLRPQRRALVES